MLYRFCRILVRIFMTIVFWMRVEGNENVPKEGPVLVCANHISNWDPLAVASGLKRTTTFMAKKELFHNPFMAALMRTFHVFPVDRQQRDAGAVFSAIHLLKDGKMVLIFPQGKRELPGEHVRPKSGAVRIASMAGVPIVPVGVSGKYHPFGKIWVRIGKPIYLEAHDVHHKLSNEQYQALSDEVMQKIRECTVSNKGKNHNEN